MHRVSRLIPLALVAGILVLMKACDSAPAPTQSAAPANAQPAATPAAETAPAMDLYSLKLNTLDGKAADLADCRGKVTLVVNVASRCGYTPQYKGLQALHAELADKGFAVLGFPCNDFGAQEPGSADEIREFCSSRYSVTFPMFEKLQTKAGAGQSPVYAMLEQATGKLPNWNFCKYLVGKDGKPIQFFGAGTSPDSAELRAAIDRALN